MTIVNSRIIRIINKARDRRGIYEQHTDQFGVIHEYRYSTDAALDEVAELAINAAKIDLELPNQEVIRNVITMIEEGEEIVPDYSAQADYDRKMLAQFMLEDDPRVFLNALSFFQAVETRGGANANQRASYLGVPRAEYDLVAKRFSDVQGAAFFINDDKEQIWQHPLPGWE